MKVPYLLLGGFVNSKADKDWQYISAKSLVDLYQISPADCTLVEEFERYKLNGLDVTKYIVLGPRSEGDYMDYRQYLERNHAASNHDKTSAE